MKNLLLILTYSILSTSSIAMGLCFSKDNQPSTSREAPADNQPSTSREDPVDNAIIAIHNHPLASEEPIYKAIQNYRRYNAYNGEPARKILAGDRETVILAEEDHLGDRQWNSRPLINEALDNLPVRANPNGLEWNGIQFKINVEEYEISENDNPPGIAFLLGKVEGHNSRRVFPHLILGKPYIDGQGRNMLKYFLVNPDGLTQPFPRNTSIQRFKVKLAQPDTDTHL